MPNAKPEKLRFSPEKKSELKRKKTIKSKPIRFPVAIERRYMAQLYGLASKMTAEINAAVLQSAQNFTGDAKEKSVEEIEAETKRINAKIDQKQKAAEKKIDDTLKAQLENIKKSGGEREATAIAAKKLQGTLEKIGNKYDSLFARKAREVANKMVMDINKASAIQLNGTLREMSGQMTLKMDFMNKPIGKEIRAALFENTKLIRSIPDAYMARVQKTLHHAAVHGGDMTGLANKIAQQGAITERRAKNIALDQTRKTFATINQHRMKAVGIKQFEWVHSGGGANPREFHMMNYPAGLNGGIFDLDDPPVIDEETGETGLPADLPNCKCVMAAVVSFDEFDDENWVEPDEE